MKNTLGGRMRHVFLKTLLSVLSVLGVGAAHAAPPVGEPLQGFVSEETLPGLLTFRRCQAGKLVPRPYLVEDTTANRSVLAGVMAVRETQMDRERPLYVEFHGHLSDKLVKAQRFERAIGFVENCAAALQVGTVDAVLFAEGMNPVSWRFVSNAAGARLLAMGAKPIRFAAKDFSAPVVDGATKIYDAWSRLDGGSIRVEITEQACVDPSAETAFGARAVVRSGSRVFEGCAARF